jgi:hypothetical protein
MPEACKHALKHFTGAGYRHDSLNGGHGSVPDGLLVVAKLFYHAREHLPAKRQRY